ncbi:MAG: ATP-binding cassette domain-containing protein, partial [Burkholderiales bacterium]|nr:ATP-binding cassette domain-containing protein [Burkholderiales bacterium]
MRHPLAREFEPQPAPEGGMPMRLSGSVMLRDVTVAYSPLSPALIDGLSLQVPPGGRVALVGGSGSGKTTVGRLISGMLEPWSGDILFDGRPAAYWPRPLLRRSLSVVDQEIVLFEGTVHDNLSMWDDSMPLDQVIQAAKDALIHDVIMSRPGGYE